MATWLHMNVPTARGQMVLRCTAAAAVAVAVAAGHVLRDQRFGYDSCALDDIGCCRCHGAIDAAPGWM